VKLGGGGGIGNKGKKNRSEEEKKVILLKGSKRGVAEERGDLRRKRERAHEGSRGMCGVKARNAAPLELE